MPNVCIIAIVARDGAIGRGGDQPFHIRDDFRRFKALTLGHPIIMGRRTFQALPGGALPGRRNIVVTRSASWYAPGIETAPSLEAAIALAGGKRNDGNPENENAPAGDDRKHTHTENANEIFIIGGGEIYRQALPLADTLYLTEVDADVPDADTFFPNTATSDWRPTETSPIFTDPRSAVKYRFVTYRRTV